MADGWAPGGIDTSVPSPARIYDYLLGGKDNFAVDRAAADKILEALPDVLTVATENRAFLGRAVRHVAEQGVRQFIDLGAGLPTNGNVHQVAHEVHPDARVVYVDNDAMAAAHARALLRDDKVAVVHADIREPSAILADEAVTRLIDFDEPFALVATAVLHFISDADDPHAILAAFTAKMAPGSHLILTHGSVPDPSHEDELVNDAYKGSGTDPSGRTPASIRAFFNGLDFLAPGDLVQPRDWPTPTGAPAPKTLTVLAGVARKP
ncbi:SAM-dependent methyltransferase [Actinomadura rupiterrae]|uniref:SAM-dependent methyltransferase n=1 Tax=Actinomadura rupiterrae TaxID=559627 RepID=UPI0020A40EFD|nr:SAM-dependent methyltransferase [Actinomadura rupiterrae]MCP2335963.1 O-methyltransferase involved in polyketide biosynthesis [Actinomadura rupiterrae]